MRFTEAKLITVARVSLRLVALVFFALSIFETEHLQLFTLGVVFLIYENTISRRGE